MFSVFRKNQREHRHLAGLALDLCNALMQAHDRSYDRQAQPGAALGAGATTVDSVEPVEQMRQVLRFDARTWVTDKQANLAGTGLDDQCDGVPWRAMAQGIGQQVGDRPLNHQAVPLNPRATDHAEHELLVLCRQGKQLQWPVRA